MSTRIQLRHDSAADWTASNPILARGEPGYEDDTGLLKFGDGIVAWNSLDYFVTGDSVPPPITVSGTRIVEFGYAQSELAHGSYTGFENETKIREVLQAIKDSGATQVRVAGWWIIIEPVKDAGYVWTGMDRFMNVVSDYGLEPIVCITAGTGLAPTGATVADFGQLCGALAARYGSGGTDKCRHWELWNEPNHRSFFEPFDASFGAAKYTELLIAGSNAIRASDTHAFIISAGLMSTANFSTTDILPSTFLQGIYDNGGRGYFDAIGFHWYSGEPDFSDWDEPSTSQYFYEDLLACRAVAVAEGDTEIPFMLTEIGFDRSRSVVDPNVRAEWLIEQIELIVDLPWVSTFIIYQMKDSGVSDGVNGFGSIDFALGKQQPTYDVVANINAVSPAVPDNSLLLSKFIDGIITGAKLHYTGSGGSGKFLAIAGDGSLTAATPGGGGSSLPGYVGMVGAIAEDGTLDITHGLNTWFVDVILTRSWLDESLALNSDEPGQDVGIDWVKTPDLNVITLKPSSAIAANEYIVSVVPTDATYDTAGPTAGTISATAGLTTADLTITGGTDSGVGLAGVEWYRDGIAVGTSPGNTFTDTGLATSHDHYNYTAKRFDYFGTRGDVSNTLPVTTLAPSNVAPIGSVYQNRSAGSGSVAVTPNYAAGSLRIAIAEVSVSHTSWVSSADYDTMTVVGGTTGAWTKLDLEHGSPYNTDVGASIPGQPSGGVHLFYKLMPDIAASGETLTATFADAAITPVNAMISVRQYEFVDQASPFGTPVIQNASSATSVTVTSNTGDYTIFGAGYHSGAGVPSGYNRTLVGSIQGGTTAGYCHYLVHGEYPGAASVAHTLPTNTNHGAFAVNLKKAA